LFEGGEHGQFAARLAAQVVKAYVEKERRQPTKVAKAALTKAEVGGVWSEPDSDGRDRLQAAHFFVEVPTKRLPLATAAPGVQ